MTTPRKMVKEKTKEKKTPDTKERKEQSAVERIDPPKEHQK